MFINRTDYHKSKKKRICVSLALLQSFEWTIDFVPKDHNKHDKGLIPSMAQYTFLTFNPVVQEKLNLSCIINQE